MLPVALTIAGSDSGGGAGIQADLKTFHAFGVFGTSAVTALTAQNTRGVAAVHAVPADMVSAQIRAVVEDLGPAACKSGMLATAELVQTVADSIRELGLRDYVLDPVIVSTSGHRLLAEDAIAAVREVLLPVSSLVTPNLDEAALLVGEASEDEPGMRRAAERLVALGAGAALVKGGHLEREVVVDVLFDGHAFHSWRRPKLTTRSTHGTGCTLSAAIVAGLAHGRPLRDAVEDGLDFVARALAEAPGLGSGYGPLNHFVPAGRVLKA
jgi:hydroxymethylpyrimidine/phosphomethylpyrimidine kinase